MVQGDELNAVDRVSVNPGDRDPLRSGGHQVYSLLQQAEGVVNFIVDDGLVEVVSVGLLQHLRFLLEPLKRVILRACLRRREGSSMIGVETLYVCCV